MLRGRYLHHLTRTIEVSKPVSHESQNEKGGKHTSFPVKAVFPVERLVVLLSDIKGLVRLGNGHHNRTVAEKVDETGVGYTKESAAVWSCAKYGRMVKHTQMVVFARYDTSVRGAGHDHSVDDLAYHWLVGIALG